MSQICVFPGQGSQEVGMGGDLFERFPELVAKADAILGYSIADLCLKDEEGIINQTQYTQPALYVVSAFTWLASQEDGAEKPVFVAGHSLGEYVALFAAGVFDFETGLKLVQKRGEIMSRVEGGGMAAVLGLDADAIRETIANADLSKIDVANFNAPTQTVLSGLKADVEAAADAFKAAGAKRYVVLPVSGAFHSRYMKESQEEFTAFASEFSFNAPSIPVVSNVTAKPYENDKILETLVTQISSSVRWVESVRYMVSQEPEAEYLELGPKKVLAGLIRQIRR